MIWCIPSHDQCSNKGIEIDIISDPDLFFNCCEFNVDSYIRRFGGEKIEGCYVLKHTTLPLFQLVKHFVVKQDNDYIDVTPFEDQRVKNYFLPIQLNIQNLFTYSLDSISNIQETDVMYYVYCYVDPATNLPFYVGKGKQRRAYVHMSRPRDSNINKNKTRFKNKIEKMKRQGVTPKIIFLAQNIKDEDIAYAIEESYIKQYGRKGYDPKGILLNVCNSSKPPNFKGMTYEEIYGKKKAKEQRELRSRLQKARGGYGPDRHTTETKQKIKNASTGDSNANNSNITKQQLLKIGKEFCNYFDNKISNKKWKYWTKKHSIPLLRKTYRFNHKDILSVFCEKFNAVKQFDSMLWFYHPVTKQNYRCFDWELKIKSVPSGFVRGRGYYPKKKDKVK